MSARQNNDRLWRALPPYRDVEHLQEIFREGGRWKDGRFIMLALQATHETMVLKMLVRRDNLYSSTAEPRYRIYFIIKPWSVPSTRPKIQVDAQVSCTSMYLIKCECVYV